MTDFLETYPIWDLAGSLPFVVTYDQRVFSSLSIIAAEMNASRSASWAFTSTEGTLLGA